MCGAIFFATHCSLAGLKLASDSVWGLHLSSLNVLRPLTWSCIWSHLYRFKAFELAQWVCLRWVHCVKNKQIGQRKFDHSAAGFVVVPVSSSEWLQWTLSCLYVRNLKSYFWDSKPDHALVKMSALKFGSKQSFSESTVRSSVPAFAYWRRVLFRVLVPIGSPEWTVGHTWDCPPFTWQKGCTFVRYWSTSPETAGHNLDGPVVTVRWTHSCWKVVSERGIIN